MSRSTLAWALGALIAVVAGVGTGLLARDLMGLPARWWPLAALALTALCLLPARREAERFLERRGRG